jgi:AcrR family transcriptional regulator
MMTVVERPTDGRTARRERNRREIVDALLELISEGAIEASAAEVATRAGLSERSVFRYFDDVNDLYSEVCAVQFARVQRHARIDRYARGSTARKVTAFVDQRVALHRAIGRVGVAARAHAHRNPVIARQLREARTLLRRQIAEHFGTEITALPELQRQAAIATIDLTTSYESIELLLTEHQMNHPKIKQILVMTINKVLR